MQDEARELDDEKAKVAAGLKDEERTSEYFLVLEQLERTRADVRRVVQRPENCLPYIQVRGVFLLLLISLQHQILVDHCVPNGR